MSGLSDISEYFGKGVSGFVGNKFRVEIAALGFPKLRFYAKKCSLPYESLLFVEDIYVSEYTLAKPKNVLSVQSFYDLGFTFRMDPQNQIIKNIHSIFNSTHNIGKFETSSYPTLFTVSVTVYGENFSIVYNRSFSNCSIVEMNAYDLDSSDRKLKEYEIKILTNCDVNYSGTGGQSIGGGRPTIVKCTSEANKVINALKRYRTAFNKNTSTSPVGQYRLDESAIMNALRSSGVLNVLGEAKKNITQCPRLSHYLPFQISDYVNPSANDSIRRYASECGLNASTDIQFMVN